MTDSKLDPVIFENLFAAHCIARWNSCNDQLAQGFCSLSSKFPWATSRTFGVFFQHGDQIRMRNLLLYFPNLFYFLWRRRGSFLGPWEKPVWGTRLANCPTFWTCWASWHRTPEHSSRPRGRRRHQVIENAPALLCPKSANKTMVLLHSAHCPTSRIFNSVTNPVGQKKVITC